MAAERENDEENEDRYVENGGGPLGTGPPAYVYPGSAVAPNGMAYSSYATRLLNIDRLGPVEEVRLLVDIILRGESFENAKRNMVAIARRCYTFAPADAQLSFSNVDLRSRVR